ncbi:hypothetical protein CDL15_Pgr011909 [Punica granatum]|uniref:Uncharacterized protein n=1 Tax=Punica granatum TaxID=22663 RepID=A0A218WD36_PUNGR|nr:hypothetical protein CDL15_Pgr011909 [Punica granatum]
MRPPIALFGFWRLSQVDLIAKSTEQDLGAFTLDHTSLGDIIEWILHARSGEALLVLFEVEIRQLS